MKTVGVTGGSGFIGSYVIEWLEELGHQAMAFDHADHYTDGDVFLGDIKNPVDVTEFAAHIDGMIHLAGVLGTQETIGNPLPAVETNILGGVNVLQACSQAGIPLVNIAVGNHFMLNPYSITKTTVEKFCEMYRRERGLQVSVVRAFNAYGPRQSAVPPYGSSRVRKIIPSFICRALSGEPIEIYGDGSQVMDMIHASDVAQVLVRALIHTADKGSLPHVVEAGTGRRTTVREIAEIVRDAVFEYAPAAEIIGLPMRPGETENSVVLADISTLEVLGIEPAEFTELGDGVVETVAYFAHYLQEREAA